MSRPTLFYSRFCRFSSSLLENEQRIKSFAMMVCIDNMDRKLLPPSLHSVPALYLPHNHTVVYGEQAHKMVNDFLENQNSQNRQNSQNSQNSQNNEVLPFTLTSGMGDQFSMITNFKPEVGENTHMTQSYPFQSLEDFGASVNISTTQTGGADKISEAAFERILKERDADLATARKAGGSSGGGGPMRI